MLSLRPAHLRFASSVRVHKPENVCTPLRSPLQGLRKQGCTPSLTKHSLGFWSHPQLNKGLPLRHDRPRLRSAYVEDMYEDDDEEIIGQGDVVITEESAEGAEMYENLLDEEEETEFEGPDEIEEAQDASESPEETAEDNAEGLDEMPSGCPKGFLLNCLWLRNYVAISVDQVFNKEQRSPLTEYFIWGRTDAWEELKDRLFENPWIDETDQILLLNRATEIINFWQDGQTHSLEEAREEFPDCVFMGSSQQSS